MNIPIIQMPLFLAGPVQFSPETMAVLYLILGAIFVLPVYLGLLLIGYLLRKRLVIKPFFKYLFILSVPTAFLLVAAAGTGLAASWVLAHIALLVGILAVITIVVQTVQANNSTLYRGASKPLRVLVAIVGIIVIVATIYINTDRILKDRREAKWEACMVNHFGEGYTTSEVEKARASNQMPNCPSTRKDWGILKPVFKLFQ